MKLCISVLALLLLTAGVKSDLQAEYEKIDTACRAESKVSQADVATFFNADFKENLSDALKCHLKCIMEKQGHWVNGGFDSATAIKQLVETPSLKSQAKDITKVLNDCKDTKGADECDTAYLITKCIFDHHPLRFKEIV